MDLCSKDQPSPTYNKKRHLYSYPYFEVYYYFTLIILIYNFVLYYSQVNVILLLVNSQNKSDYKLWFLKSQGEKDPRVDK